MGVKSPYKWFLLYCRSLDFRKPIAESTLEPRGPKMTGRPDFDAQMHICYWWDIFPPLEFEGAGYNLKTQ